jgi:hypothetical protein
LNETVLKTFIRYLAEGPGPHDRLSRLLQRMVQARLFLNRFLQMRFPTMIIFGLIRRRCMLKRFTASCQTCVERARFGCDILSELISQADTPFGVGILEEHCGQVGDDFIYALMNGLILLRLADNRKRFLQRWKPIEALLAKVSEILINEEPVSSKTLN